MNSCKSIVWWPFVLCTLDVLSNMFATCNVQGDKDVFGAAGNISGNISEIIRGK